MKRINPFSVEFQKIKKRKAEERARNEYQHYYNSNWFDDDEGFQVCWWTDYFIEKNYKNLYLSPSTIWNRYNNQLGMEIYNFQEDMEYIERLPEDYKMQNNIIQEFNKILDIEEYYNMMYYHYHLCKFLDKN